MQLFHAFFQRILSAATTAKSNSRRSSTLDAKRIATPLFTATLALLATQVVRAAPQDPCETSEVILNTGYDHDSGSGTLAINGIDPRWIVVSDPFVSTSEPRPATVIQKNVAWQNPQAQSQWISGYPTSIQNQNGAYIFETVFCLKPGIDFSDVNARLEIAMRADDSCTAYLNGSSTPFHTGQVFSAASVTTSSYKLGGIGGIGAVVGQNTLRIRVDNTGNVAMGLNLVAKVFAAPDNTAEKPACCAAYGAVQGFKFNDLNGNGMLDLGEPYLSGWTINLSGSNGVSLTAITDSDGFYNFVDLPAWIYTVTETMQAGWVQTYPPSGSHVVNITGIQGFNGLAFGNKAVGPCDTDEVLLNTGYDHVALGTLAIGSSDPRWIVVSDPIASTIEPRPATVISKHVGWQNPEPQSQWISGYPTSVQSQNGAYIFETTFCLGQGFDLANVMAHLDIGMRADDACSARLNNGPVFHVGQTFSAASMTISSYSLAAIGAVVGPNTLTIQVDNIFSVAMGLDVIATVVAPLHTAEKPECCSPYGVLQGLKFHDLNANGVRDLGEVGLSGWQINLSGSNSLLLAAVTDSAGYYSFINLPPATYTLTETMQLGWTQTAPASGSHVVTLTGIQGVNGLDFGNVSNGPAGPVIYCTSSTSTNGCVAEMSASQQPSASLSNSCQIAMSQMEGQKFGLLFYGTNNTGFTPVPWSTGSTSFLCVKGPTQRTPAMNSGGTQSACDGSITLDWNAFVLANPNAVGLPAAMGDKLYFQGWYRDPPAPKSTNLSNALELTMQP